MGADLKRADRTRGTRIAWLATAARPVKLFLGRPLRSLQLPKKWLPQAPAQFSWRIVLKMTAVYWTREGADCYHNRACYSGFSRSSQGKWRLAPFHVAIASPSGLSSKQLEAGILWGCFATAVTVRGGPLVGRYVVDSLPFIILGRSVRELLFHPLTTGESSND